MTLNFYHEGQDQLDKRFSGILAAVAPKYGGLGITSGYRSPEYNAQVGGAENSRHTHGDAADIDLSSLDDAQRAALVEDLLSAGAKGFITYSDSPNMLHVDMGSDARPGVHFMHDRSNANIGSAPAWFQDLHGRHQGQEVEVADASPLSIDELLAMPEDHEPENPIDALLAMPEGPSPIDVYRDTVAPAPPRPEDWQATPQGADGFDLTAKYAQPGLDLAGASAGYLSGAQGPIDYLARAPIAAGGVALGGLGAAYGGLAGLAGDAMQAVGLPGGERFARDMASMPDAFAGSPGPIVGGAATKSDDIAGRGARAAVKATKPERQSLGELAYRASRGDAKAQAELARLSDIDKKSAAAAERLGIDVPADVLGNNRQIDEIAGMIRTAKGSDASAAWEDTVRKASQRAGEVLSGQGNASGTADAADAVRRSLKDSIAALDDAAGPVFRSIEDGIPRGVYAKAPNMTKTLGAEIEKLGGIEALTPAERRVYKAVTSEEGLTYARLERLRRELGRAAFEGKGPYQDADTYLVSRLYDAVRSDMLDHVEGVLGADRRKALEGAFALKSESHTLKKNLADGFGKMHTGSIAPLLTRAVRSGSKGDVKALNDVLRIVPEDLRKDALVAAIGDLTQTNDAFSFGKYRTIWDGLQGQPPVMAMLRDTLGKGAFATMQDLGRVSGKIQKALDQTQAAKRTGASLTAQYFVDNMATRVMNSAAGRTMASVAAGSAAGAVAGPVVGAGTAAGVSSLSLGGKRARVASEFLNSAAFRNLAIEAATSGQAPEKAIQAAQTSVAFKDFARMAGIDNPNNWLATAVAASLAKESRAQKD